MKCQMPGCKNRCNHITRKDAVFSGIYLEDIKIYTCNKHTDSEVQQELEKIGQEEADMAQTCNPFSEILQHKP